MQYNKYDIMFNSIMKNIQEFTEFLVDTYNENNYYNLVEKMHNINMLLAKHIKAKNDAINYIEAITKDAEQGGEEITKKDLENVYKLLTQKIEIKKEGE